MEIHMHPKGQKLRFCLLEVAFWCIYGAFTTFAVSYSLSGGMTATLVGAMAASYTLCAFSGQLLFGRLCDKMGAHKPIFICGTAFLLLANLAFYYCPTGLCGILFFGLIGLVQQPMGANLDTWVIKSYLDAPSTFGQVRACSTLGFALLMPVQGILISKVGYLVMPISAALFGVTAICLAAALPDAPKVPVVKENAGGLKRLLKNAPIMCFLPVLFFMGAANAPQIQLTALLVAGVGGTVVHQSYVMFFNSIAQSPILMLSGKLARVPAILRIHVSIVVFISAIVCILFAKNPVQLMLCYILNGAGSAIYFPAMRQMMLELAPISMQTTAQGLGDAVYVSLAGMTSTMISGVIVDQFGVYMMALAALSFQTVALVLVFRYRRRMGEKYNPVGDSV